MALRALAVVLGALLVLLLGLPLLSLVTSLAATVIVAALGLPVAYLLATADFRGKRVLETFVDLPMVLPPTVAGVALLTAFGRTGLAGHALSALTISAGRYHQLLEELNRLEANANKGK